MQLRPSQSLERVHITLCIPLLNLSWFQSSAPAAFDFFFFFFFFFVAGCVNPRCPSTSALPSAGSGTGGVGPPRCCCNRCCGGRATRAGPAPGVGRLLKLPARVSSSLPPPSPQSSAAAPARGSPPCNKIERNGYQARLVIKLVMRLMRWTSACHGTRARLLEARSLSSFRRPGGCWNPSPRLNPMPSAPLRRPPRAAGRRTPASDGG